MEKDLYPQFSKARLAEIADIALRGLMEDDMGSAMEFFREEIELTDEEREFFGVPTESEE